MPSRATQHVASYALIENVISTKRRALAPDVTNFPDENPALIGSHCADCAATVWPRQDHCPRCSGPNMTDLLLPRQGTLEAWTTQGFVPKLPYAGGETAEGFTPFGVGLIRLGDVGTSNRRSTTGPVTTGTNMSGLATRAWPFSSRRRRSMLACTNSFCRSVVRTVK